MNEQRYFFKGLTMDTIEINSRDFSGRATTINFDGDNVVYNVDSNGFFTVKAGDSFLLHRVTSDTTAIFLQVISN